MERSKFEQALFDMGWDPAGGTTYICCRGEYSLVLGDREWSIYSGRVPIDRVIPKDRVITKNVFLKSGSFTKKAIAEIAELVDEAAGD